MNFEIAASLIFGRHKPMFVSIRYIYIPLFTRLESRLMNFFVSEFNCSFLLPLIILSFVRLQIFMLVLFQERNMKKPYRIQTCLYGTWFGLWFAGLIGVCMCNVFVCFLSFESTSKKLENTLNKIM